MMLNRIILIILVIYALIPIALGDDDYSVKFIDPDGFMNSINSDSSSNSPPVIQGSSSSQIVLPAEIAPLNITRKIIHPKREGSFFLDDTIVVLVKVTSMKEGNLENVEIWEIPGKDLRIESCSYPIRTSVIKDMLDYEVSDKSFLSEEDIINISHIKNLLISGKGSYRYINKLLSPNTTALLNKSNSSKNHIDLTKSITNDFNKLINSNSLKDINSSLLIKYNIPLSLKNVYTYNLNSTNCDSLNDYRIIKRRLLENLFPNTLKNLSFYKEHEDFKFDKASNSINVPMHNLYQSESIIFKYYLRPQNYGATDIRSIVRTKGFLYEVSTPVNIIEREPQFEIKCWTGSKELTLNTATKFEYYVKYLGGNEANNLFIANITAPPFCNISEDDTRKYLNLPIGKYVSFTVNATYNKTGSTYSPPIVSIGRYKQVFPEDIEVYSERDKNAKISYEAISLDYVNQTKNISEKSLYVAGITTLIALVELFIMLWFDKRHKEKIDKILIDHNKVIDAHNEAMSALREAIWSMNISNQTKSIRPSGKQRDSPSESSSNITTTVYLDWHED